MKTVICHMNSDRSARLSVLHDINHNFDVSEPKTNDVITIFLKFFECFFKKRCYAKLFVDSSLPPFSSLQLRDTCKHVA